MVSDQDERDKQDTRDVLVAAAKAAGGCMLRRETVRYDEDGNVQSINIREKRQPGNPRAAKLLERSGIKWTTHPAE